MYQISPVSNMQQLHEQQSRETITGDTRPAARAFQIRPWSRTCQSFFFSRFFLFIIEELREANTPRKGRRLSAFIRFSVPGDRVSRPKDRLARVRRRGGPVPLPFEFLVLRPERARKGRCTSRRRGQRRPRNRFPLSADRDSR